MKKCNILIVSSLLLFNLSYAQNNYELDLKPENWNIDLTLFYISNVVDDRVKKNDSGFLLSDKKTITVS